MFRFPFNGNYPITQRFDENPDWYRPYGLPAHEGVDFGMPVGTPLVSVSNATIKEVIHDPMRSAYGTMLRTAWTDESGQKWETIYAHLSEITVKKGDEVKVGDVIARSGNTGRTTGPHLHFSLKKMGTRTASKHGGEFRDLVDPLPLLSKDAAGDGTGSDDGTVVTAPEPLQGIRYRVTSPTGLRVREFPTTTARVTEFLVTGSIIMVDANISQEADGYVWRKLIMPPNPREAAATVGWVAERQIPTLYLEPISN